MERIKSIAIVGRIMKDGKIDKYVLFSTLTRGYGAEGIEKVWNMAKQDKITNCIAYEQDGKHIIRGTNGTKLSEVKEYTLEQYEIIKNSGK